MGAKKGYLASSVDGQMKSQEGEKMDGWMDGRMSDGDG